MKLAYTVEMPDLVAFNQYHVDQSDFVKASRRKSIIVVCAIYGALGVLHSLVRGSPFPIILWSLAATVYVLWYSRASRRVSLKRVEKLYGSDKNKGILCPHEIELVDDGVIERTTFGEHKTTFPGIEKIARTDAHGFIFIGTMNAHVIPKERVTEGGFEAFMKTLKERWESQQDDTQH